MKRFLSKMVYHIISGDGVHAAQFDEQWRLVKAGSIQEAWRKAMDIGRKSEDQFYNHKQELVQWKFINVSELREINIRAEGVEIYSSIKEVENANAYIRFVNDAAMQLTKGPQRLMDIA